MHKANLRQFAGNPISREKQRSIPLGLDTHSQRWRSVLQFGEAGGREMMTC